MRVTNSMISNSAKIHIGSAKNKLLKYEEQYTSQQKIQRPSDDPTVAVRSLKLRTTYSQLNQYVEKNVKDAMNWMDTTETALENIGSLLTQMKGYLNQGNCDDLETDQRQSVLSTLKQYVDSIFEDEANTDYSGRYLFTGYRTDTSLLFSTATDKLEYKITEEFGYDSFRSVTSVTGGASYDSTITNGQQYVDAAATTTTAYRLQLAYDNCADSVSFTTENDANGNPVPIPAIDFKFTDADGKDITADIMEDTGGNTITPTVKLSTSGKEVRKVGDDEILYLYDTGEVLMGKNVYSRIQENQANISVDYCKKEFNKSDIRPEMYFKATCHDTVTNKTINYVEPSNQNIRYEVNYSQTVTVNTQARDAISTDIYRNIDYIAQTIEATDEVDKKIAECEKLISNTTDKTKLAALNSLKNTLEDEKKLRVSVMAEAFGMGLTMVDKVEEKLNVAIAELGAKYNRTQLTSDKLLDTRLDTEERLSDNEGVDLPDVYINLTQADNLYQASLSATSKILGNSLLDYI